MSSSVHVDNKGKDNLILDEGPTHHGITFTAEAKYPINFTQSRKRSVLSLHYNGSNSFFQFVDTTKVYQFKAKNSEIKDYALRLGMFQKILQLITWKNSIKRSDTIFFYILTIFYTIF